MAVLLREFFSYVRKTKKERDGKASAAVADAKGGGTAAPPLPSGNGSHPKSAPGVSQDIGSPPPPEGAADAQAPSNGKAAGGKSVPGANASAKVDAGDNAEGLGGSAGYGDKNASFRKTEDGGNIQIKQEKKLPVVATNFKVWHIPCYVKGGFKATVEGTAIFGDSSGGSIAVTGSGSIELGVGGTSKEVTAGPYGSIELSIALRPLTVKHGDKNGWEIEGGTIPIHGTGKVGIKVDISGGPSLNIDHQVANWELFVLCMGRYANGKFEFFEVRAGKDLMRLIAALERGGAQVEATVEKYAPQVVKDAAVDGAQWAAESDTAGDIADKTGQALDKVKEETGVDVGAGVEEVVQSLVDENGETGQEATDRVNEELRKFEDCRDDLHTCMAASGLNGELRPFRSTEEYNAIVDVWQAESENIAKGKEAPGAWRGMIDALVQEARKRQKQQKAEEARKKKEKQGEEDAKLQAEIDAAVKMMEGARTGATGQGNVLNNRLKANPNPNGQKYFDKGWSEWSWAESARNGAQGAQGRAKIQQALNAAAAYAKVKETWTMGIHQL
jgi:hypothetical protein